MLIDYIVIGIFLSISLLYYGSIIILVEDSIDSEDIGELFDWD